ncbi:hypothetical protein LB467_13135 [Salegentibacter sp. JZCK2]|uniref:SdrD B-like domain-containing protein n=1 Tax=Salegentibacter tibetensis TaxID=2873600 RepID=UPI001CCCFF21|nr:SdrD B-like domain-containing protein [Salegentibacter tibetensis]MBZ9730633.1 hypothetical protein [Salegentibacter tibetensis]
MKLCNYQWVGVLLLGLILFGCEPSEESIFPNEREINTTKVAEEDALSKLQETLKPDYFLNLLEPYETSLINTYTLEFTGRSLTENEENQITTFYYTLTGGGETPQLDSFFLETPDCAGDVVNYSPQESANLFPKAIKWNSSVSKDGSQDYSITYEGDMPLGVINATVTRGSIEDTGQIIGPCKGVYTLSGSIYIDANNSGDKQEAESGISSIPIDLYNIMDEKIGSVPTASDGSFSFRVIEGDYRIKVTDDLLENDNYTAIGSSYIDVEDITENVSGLNFGFQANTQKIIEDLETTVLLDTEPTKYWIQQLRHAGKKNSDYTKEDILVFLSGIEELLLMEPFQFGDDKQANALDILTRPIKTDLDEYLQQLLTAELNVISGRGAKLTSGEPDSSFNDALLIYGEAVACRELGTCPGEEKAVSVKVQTKAVSSNDTRLLTSFNGTGGI